METFGELGAGRGQGGPRRAENLPRGKRLFVRRGCGPKVTPGRISQRNRRGGARRDGGGGGLVVTEGWRGVRGLSVKMSGMTVQPPKEMRPTPCARLFARPLRSDGRRAAGRDPR